MLGPAFNVGGGLLCCLLEIAGATGSINMGDVKIVMTSAISVFNLRIPLLLLPLVLLLLLLCHPS